MVAIANAGIGYHYQWMRVAHRTIAALQQVSGAVRSAVGVVCGAICRSLHEMIYFHPYELTALASLNSRSERRVCHGALIRVNNGVGCIHPWPELGDAPLDQQLKALRLGSPTPLTTRALACCQVDAEARSAGRNLFADKIIPSSHATCVSIPFPDQCEQHITNGFDTLKIKLQGANHDFLESLEALAHFDVRLRLDFNESSSPHQIAKFADSITPPLRSRIEFIEDPFPYHASTWIRSRRETFLPFALDQDILITEPESFDVQVWKPAKSKLPTVVSKLVVTSYMDHAIGQMFAAYEAACLERPEVCGLLTHPLFEPDAFFSRVTSQGPQLLAPEGTGLGFDDLIESLPWKRLH